MTIRRRQTIGGPKTIDAINSSSACNARNVPPTWCIGRSSCRNRSSVRDSEASSRIERTQRERRRRDASERGGGHQTQRGMKRTRERMTFNPEEGGVAHAGTVWFAACRSVDCSPIAPRHQRHQPGTVPSYTGCTANVRIKLGKWRFYDKFAQDCP